MRSTARRAGVVVAVILGAALFCAIHSSVAGADRRSANNNKSAAAAAGLQQYDSPYYEIYSDLEKERVQEAVLRMTRMAEEYHDRTKDFSGAIRQKFPFYLFREAQDYFDAGGLPGSAGVFMVRGDEAKLMAIAGEKSNNGTWHVVQHEGFHQFAHAVIGGELPPWLNEGLAEYFGEGIYTGDGMVTGVVSPGRLKRVQESIKNKRFKSMQRMMLLSHQQWNAEMDGTNYDMAWSMAHFLAHGDGGRYQGAFTQFVKDIGRGRPWDKVWLANFGSAEGFEKKWADWWLAQEPLATKDLYVKAVVTTVASYVGRASLQKQTFDNMEEFTRAAKDGSIKIAPADWLPPSLATSMLEIKEKLGDDVKYEIRKDPKGPQVVANMADGTRLVATFVRAGAKRVVTSIDDLAPVMARVKGLIGEKKKGEAKAMLQDAIKRNPTSPLVAEARKLLPQTM